MQIKKLETILNEILIDLPFLGGKICQLSIWKDQKEKGWITKIQEQDESVFDYNRIYLKIEDKSANGFIDDNIIKFTIPTNKENLFKSLVNTILAYLEKEDIRLSKSLERELRDYKNEFLEAFKIKNSNYFNNSFVYATTYGLGYYCLLMTNNEFNNINLRIGKFLEDNKIDYKNEYSKACWVYRFKFKSLKENNLKLLDNLILHL